MFAKISPKLFIATSLFALAAAACSPAAPTPAPEDNTPITGSAVTVSPNARILSGAARNALVWAAPDLSRLRFTRGPDTAFLPGHLLVSEATAPGGLLPDGLLMRVVAVRDAGGLLEVDTTPASLEEVVENGDLLEEQELSLDDIEEQQIDTDGVEVFINGRPALIPQAQGEGLSAQSLAPQASKTIGKLELKIKDKVLCQLDGDDKVVMNGSFYADFKVFAKAKLKVFKLKHFSAGVEMNESSQIKISGKCSKNLFNKSIELARFKMQVRTFWIGPVPVVVRPEIVMTAGASGKVSASVNFKATHEFHARYGVEWNKGNGWDWINEKSQSFDFQAPSFSATVNAEGFIGARAGIRFYGLASAFVHPKIFADFGATVQVPQNTYKWNLDAGFRVGVGAEASLFGRELGKVEKDLLEVRKTLASGQGKL